jgi:hypothetical protein
VLVCAQGMLSHRFDVVSRPNLPMLNRRELTKTRRHRQVIIRDQTIARTRVT